MEFTIEDMMKAFKAGARCQKELTPDELTKLLRQLDPVFERKTYRSIYIDEYAGITHAKNYAEWLDIHYERPVPKEPKLGFAKSPLKIETTAAFRTKVVVDEDGHAPE